MTTRMKKLRKFLSVFCKEFDFNEEAFTGRSRVKELSNYRSMFCKMAREWGYSVIDIGKVLNRHHATVIHLSEKNFFDEEKEIIYDFMIKYGFQAPDRRRIVGAKPNYATSRLHISKLDR